MKNNIQIAIDNFYKAVEELEKYNRKEVYIIDDEWTCIFNCPKNINYYYCYCKNNLECEHKIEKLVVRKTKFDIDLLKTHNKRIFSTKEEAEEELRKIKEEE